jgi:ectoine hydroxylase-related dioxygenase (phytanoyl-CoA dioxygenase family)
MIIDVNQFKKSGYIRLENVISINDADIVRQIALDFKNEIIDNNLLGTLKKTGVERYWRGLDMASTMSPKLYEYYTSNIMYQIATSLLETNEIYLFNDQVVVKLPNEEFEFVEHTDNSFGPNNQMALNNEFKTITCCWVLDDFNLENGPISILDKTSKEWKLPLPKRGDIIIWDGNTIHKSSKNTTNLERCVWLCVYSTTNLKQIKNLSTASFDTFYGDRFYPS